MPRCLGANDGRSSAIPMVVKESFNVAGLPTTWGIPTFKDWTPKEDAVAVTRLKSAGAVILGKTNVPLVLGDWQSYNDIYGTTNNPWDAGRTPGGSSGGSAAALAAGFGSLSLGSDIGGSLRAPAHYCGVCAHKPTLGLVPLRGTGAPGTPAFPRESDLAVAGPMARSAADLALGLDVLAGPDEARAGIAYRLALPEARHGEFKNFRALVIDTHPLLPTATTMRTALDHLSQRLVKVGVKVGRDSPLVPDLAESARLYMRLLLPAFSANWPPDEYKQAQRRGRSAQPGRQEPCGRAEPRCGIESSRLDRCRQSAGRPPAAMERAFSGVGCRALSTDVDSSFSPRPQNALFGATYRDRWEGIPLFRSIGLAGNCNDAGPSRHSDTDRSFRDWAADRCSDRGALPRGPDDHRFC